MSGPTRQVEDGTAGGLIAFLTFVGKKGLVAARTAEAYKSAATRVLVIDGEDWLDTDVRSLDINLQMDRFARLQGTSYKPETLQTYRSRVKSAIAEYLRYLEDPVSYRGPTSQRPERARRVSRVEPQRSDAGALVTDSPGAEGKSRPEELPDGRPSLVKYPFPLRSGQMAYFELPRDLSRAEAQRMAAFIASLAIDTLPELPLAGEREP